MKVIDAIDVLVNVMVNTESAPNYKGWIVKDGNTGNEFVVTVQLKEGETPSEQLAAAEAEIAELKSGIEYAIDNFAYYTKETGKLLSYKQQELEVKHLMDVLAKHKVSDD